MAVVMNRFCSLVLWSFSEGGIHLSLKYRRVMLANMAMFTSGFKFTKSALEASRYGIQ